MINNKTILVTGGTGSFGSIFIEYLLKNFNPKKIMVFSRDEQKQFLMEKKLQKYRNKLRYLVGDERFTKAGICYKKYRYPNSHSSNETCSYWRV